MTTSLSLSLSLTLTPPSLLLPLSPSQPLPLQVVQVTDEAKFSSSAVDTKAFLLQMGSFWKHLNWPVPAVAYGFTVTVMEVCHGLLCKTTVISGINLSKS